MFVLLSVVRAEKRDKKDMIPYMDHQSGVIGEAKPIKNKNCKAPHTKRGHGGQCVCEEGYPSGDPSLITGCFRCTSECAKHAACSYPGKCQCVAGYTGEGNQECVTIPPILTSIIPDNGVAFSKLVVNVSFKSTPGTNFSHGFLKIRNITSKCGYAAEGVFTCTLSRLGKPGTVEISLSFDNITWSDEYVEFQIFRPELGDFIMYFFILVVIGGAVYGIYKTQTKVKKLNPQQVPFISKI